MAALFTFSIRQILGQQKLWLAAMILLFPSIVVVLMRSVGGGPRHGHLWEIYHVMMQFLLIMLMMPLTCILYGTSLIGAEVEQRTLVYLTTRRLRRATVLLVRFAATWLTLSGLAMLAIFVLHLCVTFGMTNAKNSFTSEAWEPWRDLRAYLAIAPAGIAGFLAVFATISLIFGRPLIVSVIYFVLFELIIGNLPVQARIASISHLLRKTLIQQIPEIQRLFKLQVDINRIVYPPDETGNWMLLVLVGLLLAAASVLVTSRELVPARVSRD